MRKVSLKKAITLIFGEVENLKRTKIYCSDGKEYHFFFTQKNSNIIYNLFYRDIGYTNKKVMYRQVKSYSDFIGSYNRWDFEEKLKNLGYYL